MRILLPISKLLHLFSHQIYGTSLANLTDILGCFFRLTNDLLTKFIEIVRDVVSFNCKYEDQLELLCDGKFPIILIYLNQLQGKQLKY
jgi:hypothetical protein